MTGDINAILRHGGDGPWVNLRGDESGAVYLGKVSGEMPEVAFRELTSTFVGSAKDQYPFLHPNFL
jgi:hypothetical protein